MDRAWVTKFDHSITKTITQAKQVPVAINYSIGSRTYRKIPDQNDIDLIERINQLEVPFWFPTALIPKKATKLVSQSELELHMFIIFTLREIFWALCELW